MHSGAEICGGAIHITTSICLALAFSAELQRQSACSAGAGPAPLPPRAAGAAGAALRGAVVKRGVIRRSLPHFRGSRQ